eukprot:1159102-Pelagomonas_calceolata.AAC.4
MQCQQSPPWSPGQGSSGSIRRKRKPLQRQWKRASGFPSSHEGRTNEKSGRGTAWEEQVNTYMPVSVQLLVGSNYSVLNVVSLHFERLCVPYGTIAPVVDVALSRKAPRAPEGRRQLGLHSFFRPAPPITQERQGRKADIATPEFGKQGVEADYGEDENEVPADELVRKLAQAPAGQILPVQLEQAERVGWEAWVGEAAAQDAVVESARAAKACMGSLTEKQLAEIVQPRVTRSKTAAAAAAKQGSNKKQRGSSSRSNTREIEEEDEEEEEEEGGCSEDGSKAERESSSSEEDSGDDEEEEGGGRGE